MVRNKRCTAFTGLQQFWNLGKWIFYRPPLLGMENGPGSRIDSGLWKVLPVLILQGHDMVLLNSVSVIHSGRRWMEVYHLECGTSLVIAGNWRRDWRIKNGPFIDLACEWHLSALLTICWPGLVIWVCLTEQDAGNMEAQVEYLSATRLYTPSRLRMRLLEDRC